MLIHLPITRMLGSVGLTVCMLLLAACNKDETVAGYGGADRVWELQEIDGQPFRASSTLEFLGENAVTVQGPCNLMSAVNEVPYPWFQLNQMASTKMACPDLQAEGQLFTALSEMRLSEVSGDVLLLSNDAGRQMVFKARE